MEKLRMHSPDLTQSNIDKVAELFPTVVTERLVCPVVQPVETTPHTHSRHCYAKAIDFDLLRQELSDHVVEGPQERYQLDWPGKREALFAANAPIAKTLRPVREESVDFDTTKNIFIEGDNLDALKLLQESYLGKIKLIYIDPPYNTGSDRFIYPDNYARDSARYLADSGQVDESERRLGTNTEANGRFHSDWLSMIYPLLRLARTLLTDDGVILVSINDDEHAQLRRVLDETFGSQNFLAQLIWNKQHSQQQGMFKQYHEFVLAYGRDTSCLEYISGGTGVIEAGALKKISRANPASDFTFPAGTRFDAPDGTAFTGTFGESEKVTVVSGALQAFGGRTTESVTLRAGWTQKNQMQSWFAGNETRDTRDQRVVEFYFSSTGKLKSRKERGRITPSTFLPQYGMSSQHSERLANLMGATVFDNPKPVPMLREFIEWFTDEDDIVLDFFAGSGSTAEACIQAPGRRFILVQVAEATDRHPGAAEVGYRNIAEIARDRVRRAGVQLRDEATLTSADPDVGFRAFQVDSTNMADLLSIPDEQEQGTLTLSTDSVKPGRTSEDLLFQVLLDWGLPLDLSIERVTLAGAEVFDVDAGTLVTCFDDTLTVDVIRAIAERAPVGVAVRDSAFIDDAALINAEQIFREVSPDTIFKAI